MSLERLNPSDLSPPETYTQVIVATGTRLVFVAGQVAEDAEGNLVGAGDVAVQARWAFDNVGCALVAAGARPEHVARITIYVIGEPEAHLPAIEAGRWRCWVTTSPSTRSWAWPHWRIVVASSRWTRWPSLTTRSIS